MAEANPLLSIIATSYTTERLKDICDLFDSILNQSLVISPQSIVKINRELKTQDSRLLTQDSRLMTLDYQTRDYVCCRALKGAV